MFAWQANIPRQTQCMHCSDDQPTHVELPPFQSVTGRCWEGVVIVVPAFTHRQNAANEVVGRLIVGVVIS